MSAIISSTKKDLAIRFGLGAIKNVGDGPAQVIVDARGDEPFADIDDFVDRVDLRQVNKRVLECMIRAGALDALGERNSLLASLDQMLATSQEAHRAKEIGQTSLFDFSPDVMGQAEGAKFELARNARPCPRRNVWLTRRNCWASMSLVIRCRCSANMLMTV